jgi:uncharacterized protein YbjT (DUF2867 family)
MEKAAFVLGASGSVGKELVLELISSNSFSSITCFVRKDVDNSLLRSQEVNPMTPASLEEAVIQAAKEVKTAGIVGFSVLGVGGGTGWMSIDEHRAVDVELNKAFASGLKKTNKCNHLCFMSAAGANPNAWASGFGGAGFPRYNRVKGESEEVVKADGPAVVSIFRPAMIIGSKHTPGLGEKIIPLFSFLTPSMYLSITTQQIAQSMVACAKNRPGLTETYHFPQMINWIKKSSPL